MELGVIQPGDRVRIRDWDDMAAEYGVTDDRLVVMTPGLGFTEYMRKRDCGTEFVVRRVCKSFFEEVYDELEYDDSTGILGTITNFMVAPALAPLEDGAPISATDLLFEEGI